MARWLLYQMAQHGLLYEELNMTSVVSSKKVQVGQSLTASQNFTLMVPATPDGTLELRRGNAAAPGALLAKINADGGVNSFGPAFAAYQSSLQSIPNGTITKVNLQTELFDTAAAFASSRFTPQVAGYYLITWGVGVVAAAASLIGIVYKNTSRWSDGSFSSGSAFISTGSAIVQMNGTTDFIELWMSQASGAATNSSAAPNQTYLTGALLRAL